METDKLEPVRLGDSTQWIRVRARTAGQPPLLLVQMGPGLPMLNEVRTFERLLALEDDFTVIYWDQRAIGRSLRSGAAAGDGSRVEAMVSDTEQLLAVLRERFGKPALVVGFSLGAMIAARAAERRPDLVAALVTVGLDIDGPAAEHGAYDFALAAARARGNRRAIRQLEAIGPPPHLRQEQFATRVRWVVNFGGARGGHTYNSLARGLLVSLLRSPDYSPGDVIRTLRGMTAAQAAMQPELAVLDLPRTLTRLRVPVVMVAGRHDEVAPPAAAQRYAELLQAPSKRLTWFEHSAHMPHLEEPGRFRELLAEVRLSLPANHVRP
jgi:pimeloyl-ACP methyl ester carboxylesterase